jgi:hypothetical protein
MWWIIDMNAGVRYAVLLLAVLATAGCNDMADHQRMKPLERSEFFADGISSRPLMEGTVARGQLRLDQHLYEGKENGVLTTKFPFPVTAEVMKRGKEKYETFCTPCHGRLGDGNGMIVRRGFPQPKSFHSDSVLVKPAGYFFDVMTNGFGRMYNYAASVNVHDRWAITAYIRALQYSRRIPVAQLTDTERKELP